MTITVDGKKLQQRIDKLHLEPNDIVVIKFPMPLYPEILAELRERLRSQIGTEHKIIILSDGLDVSVAIKRKIKREYMRIRREFEDALKLLDGTDL